MDKFTTSELINQDAFCQQFEQELRNGVFSFVLILKSYPSEHCFPKSNLISIIEQDGLEQRKSWWKGCFNHILIIFKMAGGGGGGEGGRTEACEEGSILKPSYMNY